MNDTISHIHCQSYHPPSIIKNLPKGIGIRLSNNSANADIFQEATKPYNNVLKNNGHNDELKYINKGTIQNKRGKTPNDSDPKKNLSPSQIIQKKKKTTTKREEGRSLGLTPPPQKKKKISRNVATNIGKKKILHITQCLLPSKQQAP